MKRLLPALLLLTTALQAGETAVEIRKHIDEYENAVRANTMKIINAKTEEEKNQYRSTIPSAEPCVKKLMELVKARHDDPEIVPAVCWLVNSGNGFPEGEEAMKLLATKYADRSGIAETVKQFEYRGLIGEPLLKAVLEKNPNKPEQAAALYALGAAHFKNFDANPDPAAAETSKAIAMDSFQKLAAQHPDAMVQGFKLNDLAGKMLFEMANLQPGCVAPEIEGKDQDGVAFKLSDYRGKHAVVVFWGGWCHACHGLMPVMADLAAQCKDKPVAVLGVNTDIEAEAKNAITTNKANFRHWLDNTNSGPNTTLYAPRAFPTLYLIGPDGKILLKNAPLEAIVQQLNAALANPPAK